MRVVNKIPDASSANLDFAAGRIVYQTIKGFGKNSNNIGYIGEQCDTVGIGGL